MTNVLVCIKRVPDVSGEVLLTEDGMSVDARHVGFTVSPHEECAVELATQLAESSGGTATVLTLGPADAVEQLRSALAVGCSAAVHVEADSDAYGPVDVANAIADVARDRDYDLILLGNDAADTGDFQVPVRLAYALDRPVVTGVSLVALEAKWSWRVSTVRTAWTSSRSRCPPSSPSWRAGSRHDTRRWSAG